MRTVRGHQVGPSDRNRRTDLKVYGMKDAAAAQAVYDALSQLEGIRQIHLDVALRRASVSHDGRPGITEKICETLQHIGLRTIQKA